MKLLPDTRGPNKRHLGRGEGGENNQDLKGFFFMRGEGIKESEATRRRGQSNGVEKGEGTIRLENRSARTPEKKEKREKLRESTSFVLVETEEYFLGQTGRGR